MICIRPCCQVVQAGVTCLPLTKYETALSGFWMLIVYAVQVHEVGSYTILPLALGGMKKLCMVWRLILR
jgi:hypothetical protein